MLRFLLESLHFVNLLTEPTVTYFSHRQKQSQGLSQGHRRLNKVNMNTMNLASLAGLWLLESGLSICHRYGEWQEDV